MIGGYDSPLAEGPASFSGKTVTEFAGYHEQMNMTCGSEMTDPDPTVPQEQDFPVRLHQGIYSSFQKVSRQM